jgi:DNA-binding transcriptional MerR regulator
MIVKERFTLEELSSKMVGFLKEYELLDLQEDGRVSDVPDARTIRYYTSLGLVDRPFIEARQAYYGKRQILQLLAIKALQTRHLPLSEIQARLYGKTERELESILKASLSRQGVDTESVQPLLWREITLEPGLKLLADENWKPADTASNLEERFRHAIDVLASSEKRRRKQQ